MKPFSDELKQKHPYEPWKWREDWMAGQARQADGVGYGCALAALFIVFPVGLLLLNDAIEKGDFWYLKGREHLLYMALAALVIGLVILGVYLGLRRDKYSSLILKMDQTPTWLGGTLSGRVEAGQPLKPHGDLSLILSCTRTTGSGKGQKQQVLWSKKSTMPPDIVARSGDHLPLHFDIPSDCQGSSWEYDEKTEWCLEIYVPTPGINLAARFPVPIFRKPPVCPSPDHATVIETREDSEEPPILPSQPRKKT